MKILIIGSGGREHALAWKIAQSPLVSEVHAAPGNPGIAELAQCHQVSIHHPQEIKELAQRIQADLVVIGPDDCLAEGLVDILSQAGIKAFGPQQAAARIESSKAFAKGLMMEEHIPTAKFASFSDYERAVDYVDSHPLPVVVKASGLALGKGAIICHSREQAHQSLHSMMRDRIFGSAGETVVIEEFLEGREISIHAFCDGREAVLFPPAQDHKAVYDGDQGPNTGGMGCICPVPWVAPEMMSEIKHRIVEPALRGLAKKGAAFVGCLYPGLIQTGSGFKVLEFNARFGDPEAQAYLPLLETDLVEVMLACLEGTLNRLEIKWARQASACVVAASEGYPGRYRAGMEISGIEQAKSLPQVEVFQAGTALKDGRLVTAGGRVLCVSARGADLDQALQRAYEAMGRINFSGMHYRRDIGRRRT